MEAASSALLEEVKVLRSTTWKRCKMAMSNLMWIPSEWTYLSVLARVGSRRHGQLMEVPSVAPAIDVHSIIGNALSVCHPFLFNPRPALHARALHDYAAAIRSRVWHRLPYRDAAHLPAL